MDNGGTPVASEEHRAPPGDNTNKRQRVDLGGPVVVILATGSEDRGFDGFFRA